MNTFIDVLICFLAVTGLFYLAKSLYAFISVRVSGITFYYIAPEDESYAQIKKKLESIDRLEGRPILVCRSEKEFNYLKDEHCGGNRVYVYRYKKSKEEKSDNDRT